jgi:hypothetical protein
MSREQVRNLLGEPDDTGITSRKYRTPSIWKYGDVELHFVPGQDRLILIFLDHFEVPASGKLVNIDPWIIRRTLTLREAEEKLTESGIQYDAADYKWADNAKSLVTGIGTQLIFLEGGAELVTVSYSQTGS